jgi:hypothetical protein
MQMDGKIKWMGALVLLVIIGLSLVVFAPRGGNGGNGNGGGGSGGPAACMNGIDDDGDGLIDYPADPGCTSKKDKDEYNAPADSCADSDGGFNTAVRGTVSGYDNGVPFNNTDYCTGNTSLVEYTCAGAIHGYDPWATPANCTTSCSNGACQ